MAWYDGIMTRHTSSRASISQITSLFELSARYNSWSCFRLFSFLILLCAVLDLQVSCTATSSCVSSSDPNNCLTIAELVQCGEHNTSVYASSMGVTTRELAARRDVWISLFIPADEPARQFFAAFASKLKDVLDYSPVQGPYLAMTNLFSFVVGKYTREDLVANGDILSMLFDVSPGPDLLVRFYEKEGVVYATSLMPGVLADQPIITSLEGCNGVVHVSGAIPSPFPSKEVLPDPNTPQMKAILDSDETDLPPFQKPVCCNHSLADVLNVLPAVFGSDVLDTVLMDYARDDIMTSDVSFTWFLPDDDYLLKGATDSDGVPEFTPMDALFLMLPGAYCPEELLAAGELESLLWKGRGWADVNVTFTKGQQTGQIVISSAAHRDLEIVLPVVADHVTSCQSIIYRVTITSPMVVPLVMEIQPQDVFALVANLTSHHRKLPWRCANPLLPSNFTRWKLVAPATAPAMLPSGDASIASSKDDRDTNSLATILGATLGLAVATVAVVLVAILVHQRRKQQQGRMQTTGQTDKHSEVGLDGRGQPDPPSADMFSPEAPPLPPMPPHSLTSHDFRKCRYSDCLEPPRKGGGPPLNSFMLQSLASFERSSRGASHNSMSSGRTGVGSNGGKGSSLGSLAPLPSHGSTESWVVDLEDIVVYQTEGGNRILLGEGCFSKVYMGEWQGLVVAIKEFKTMCETEEDVRAMLKEVSILKRCRHVNIVSFFGIGFGPQETVLVFECMQGGTLWSAIKREPETFGWKNRGKSIAVQIARGLAYLHAECIVHCDLKTLNIMLTRDGDVKIGDMGMSKFMTKAFVTRGGAMGTWAYAAPELIADSQISEKVDIFSLGVVLWEIVTGERPVRGKRREPRVPDECGQDMFDLMKRCLEVKADARPSAQEVLMALEDMCNQQEPGHEGE